MSLVKQFENKGNFYPPWTSYHFLILYNFSKTSFPWWHLRVLLVSWDIIHFYLYLQLMNIFLMKPKSQILLKSSCDFIFCVWYEIGCLINRSMIYFLLFDYGLIAHYCFHCHTHPGNDGENSDRHAYPRTRSDFLKLGPWSRQIQWTITECNYGWVSLKNRDNELPFRELLSSVFLDDIIYFSVHGFQK